MIIGEMFVVWLEIGYLLNAPSTKMSLNSPVDWRLKFN